MRKVLHYGVTRWIARVLAVLCLGLWYAPPAAAFTKPPRPKRTQTLDEERLAELAAREEKARNRPRPDARQLSSAEQGAIKGRGIYRNKYFSGVLPWQRSLRDVNLANGNLFKSFT